MLYWIKGVRNTSKRVPNVHSNWKLMIFLPISFTKRYALCFLQRIMVKSMLLNGIKRQANAEKLISLSFSSSIRFNAVVFASMELNCSTGTPSALARVFIVWGLGVVVPFSIRWIVLSEILESSASNSCEIPLLFLKLLILFENYNDIA